jgi:hypothetical protein
MIMDDIIAADPNFRGCMTDFFLQPEEIQKLEATAPVLPPRLSPGIRMPVGPETLRDAVGLISTSLRFTLQGIRSLHEPEGDALRHLMSSLRLQMTAATKLQEALMAETLKINPQIMRAFLVKEQLPRTVAPFLQKFFRGGAGGDLSLSGMDTAAGVILGLDGPTVPVDGGTPTRVPPGCAIVVSSPGAVTSQQPGNAEQQLQQLQQSAAQATVPQPPFGQHVALPQYLAAPAASLYPAGQAPQFGEFGPPFSFQPPSPRMFPLAANPFTYPFPPPVPYPGAAATWASPTVQGDPFTPPPSFLPSAYFHAAPGPAGAPPYQSLPGRGRRPGSAGGYRKK